MSESIQHKIARVRPPRVQITYDVEIGGAMQVRELPFVMGIMADLSGMREAELPSVKDRKFIEIDRDNFQDILSNICPHVKVSVPNMIDPSAEGNFVADIYIRSMADFSPINLVQNLEALNVRFVARGYLNDLLAKLDGNDQLLAALRTVAADKAKQDEILANVDADVAEGPAETIARETHMIREDVQLSGAKLMLEEFARQTKAEEGEISPNIAAYLNQKIYAIDKALGQQVDEILHYPEFQTLESNWRGLHFLVQKAETGRMLKLRLMNVSQKELLSDLENAVEFDQSQLFKKVYEEEYGTFGGSPYSCLLGVYEFGRHPQDISLLEKISQVAAAAHAPFIAAAAPKLFDLDSFEKIAVPRDLGKIFESSEVAKWNSFRKMEDSRYVALVLPHILLRLPYGPETVPVPQFNYKEAVEGMDNSKFLWGNAAFALAERFTSAHAKYKWTGAIRGVEGGGLVSGLPAYTFRTPEGDVLLKCPTEVAITDRREKELSDLGLIALCHAKGTDFAAFFGGQTIQEALKYDTDSATANAALSTKLTCMLAVSRFAHYIKVIMRDKIGSFMSGADISDYLNRWISAYVLLTDQAPQSVKAQYPLREARVDVFDDPARPGCYKATVFLRPHFQMEELTVSIRLVTELPAPA